MNRNATLLLVSLMMVSAATGFADELESRYWHALNSGRDLSSLTPIIEQLIFPPTRKRSVAALRGEALKRLEELKSQPLADVKTKEVTRVPRAGRDWPTLGGDSQHRGVATDPGPNQGVEAWRAPVGWPWFGSPRVIGDHVYTATPGLHESLISIDLKSGQRRWTTPFPGPRRFRGRRASSPVIVLPENEVAVFTDDHVGYATSYIVADVNSGKLKRQISAGMQEPSIQPPERQPKQLVAHRVGNGNAILVKSLKSGRTWWRFSTGYLPDEPVMSGALVFAAAENGNLWAFHLWGNQRIAWNYRNEEGWGARPVVMDGVLYIGGNDGSFYAFEANTGKIIWKSSLTQPDRRARRLFCPATGNDRNVYVGDARGVLYALNRATGRLSWKHDCGDWIYSRPYAQGDVVCVATLAGDVVAIQDQDSPKRLWTRRSSNFPVFADLSGNDSTLLISGSDFELVARDLQTGQMLWNQSLIKNTSMGETRIWADSMPEISQSPVTVGDGIVLFAGRTGFLNAVSAETGKLLWRFETGGRMSASPLVHQGMVFVAQVAGNQRFYALDLKSGQPKWSRLIGEVWAPPEADGSQLFVGNKKGGFFCLDPATGKIRWKAEFADGVYPAPTLDDKTVYTGSWDGHYYALNRKDGSIRWAYSPPGRPYHRGGRPDSAAPILANGLVIVPSLGGRLVALNKETGKRKWQWNGIPWRICNVTAAANQEIVLISTFGNAYELPFDIRLHAIAISNGKHLWEVSGPGGLTSPVFCGDRRFVVGSMGDPYLRGFELSNKADSSPKLLWRLRTGGVMYESLPAVSGNFAYFLSNDGWLRAVK